MRKEQIGIAGLTAFTFFAAATCRTTRTTVARVITPAPVPALAPQTPTGGPARPSATPLPVTTAAAPPSIYDRTPGVLYEQPAGPTPSAAPPASRPTWTLTPLTTTPTPRSTRVAREPAVGSPTPTQKPGAYYEPQDYRPAVTWTPTPEKRR